MAPRKAKAKAEPKAKKPRAKQAGAKSSQKAESAGTSKTRTGSPRKEAKSNPGRSTAYDPVIAQEILELLADGQTLLAICKDERFPTDATVRRWALDLDHIFSSQYTRAREIGYHNMADEIVEIGNEVHESSDAVARARLRVETRKWLLSKALPKIYGDKLALTDADGGTLKVQMVA